MNSRDRFVGAALNFGLVVLAGLVLTFLLAGCGAGADTTPSQPQTAGTPESGASILVESDSLRQYEELRISASGFLPSETVYLNIFGEGLVSPEPVAKLAVDENGSLESKTVVLPTWLTSGVRTVQVEGEKSHRQVEETIYVRATEPWMEFANFAVRPTEKVGFVGGGFDPQEDVNVYFYHQSQQKPTEPLVTIPCDLAGNFAWTEIDSPASPPGEYTLALTGAQSGSKQFRNIILVPLSPELELQPYAGIPGTKLTFSGTGFLANEKIHVFLGARENEISSFQADEFGNFWSAGIYGVPQSAKAATSSIVVTGEKSGVSVSRPFTVLDLKPWLDLSNYAGTSGTSIRFAGGGFAAGEKISVHVETRENPPIAIGKTNEEGNFWDVGPAAVPSSLNDKVTFIVVGEGSLTEARAAFQVLSRLTPTR